MNYSNGKPESINEETIRKYNDLMKFFGMDSEKSAFILSNTLKIDIQTARYIINKAKEKQHG